MTDNAHRNTHHDLPSASVAHGLFLQDNAAFESVKAIAVRCAPALDALIATHASDVLVASAALGRPGKGGSAHLMDMRFHIRTLVRIFAAISTRWESPPLILRVLRILRR